MKKHLVLFLTIAIVLGLGYQVKADLNDGLIAYYPLDGNTNDMSGNGLDGEATGTLEYADGILGSAAKFSGDDIIEVLNPEPFKTQAVTVCAWVNSVNNQTAQYITNVGWPTAPRGYGHILYLLNRYYGITDMSAHTYDENGNYHFVPIDGFAPNTWQFYCYSFDGNTMRTYRDGEFLGEEALPPLVFSDNPAYHVVTMGMPHQGRTEYALTGMMDEVRFYNRVLSDEEIQELYNGNDFDFDGMPNWWEEQYEDWGLDPYIYDAQEDLDNDGFPNILEFQYKSLPILGCSTPTEYMFDYDESMLRIESLFQNSWIKQNYHGPEISRSFHWWRNVVEYNTDPEMVTLKLTRDGCNPFPYIGSIIKSEREFGTGVFQADITVPNIDGAVIAFFLYQTNDDSTVDEIDFEILTDTRSVIVGTYNNWIEGSNPADSNETRDYYKRYPFSLESSPIPLFDSESNPLFETCGRNCFNFKIMKTNTYISFLIGDEVVWYTTKVVPDANQNILFEIWSPSEAFHSDVSGRVEDDIHTFIRNGSFVEFYENDSDADGLIDNIDPNPYDQDSDDDGETDGPFNSEDLNANGIVDPGETDPSNPDSDGDGIFDGTENGMTEPVTPDTDLSAGFFVADQDPSTTTDPTDADSDEDGILDGNEDKNHDGLVDPTQGETDPGNADSDGDGIYDGTEIGLTEPQDPAATDTAQGYFVADADPSSTTDPVNPDSDGDGTFDGDEDLNGNGSVDEGETDPGQTIVLGDLDGDSDIDASDYQIFVGSFGRCEGQPGYNAACDFDGDACITFVDYQTWYGYYANQ